MRKRVLSVLMTLCMVLTLLPVSTLAAPIDTQDLIRTINSYGLNAESTGTGIVTVTGTKENATEPLKLEIPSFVQVRWEANLTGNTPNMYGLVSITSTASVDYQGGRFYMQGGCIDNAGGDALVVTSDIASPPGDISTVYVDIIIGNGTIRATREDSGAVAINLSFGADPRRDLIDSDIYVNGGVVETLAPASITELPEKYDYSAIYYPTAAGAGSISVNGGIVRTNMLNTSAIYGNVPVSVNSGMIASGRDGDGINTSGNVSVGTSDSASDTIGGIIVGDAGIYHWGTDTSVTVENGIVFGRFPIMERYDVEYSVTENGTLIKHTIAYTDDRTYDAGSSEDLEITGAPITATWSRQDGVSGIAYQKNGMSGFFAVPGVTVIGTVLSDRQLNMQINPAELTLNTGSTAQITITDNAAQENPTYTYTSSDEKVATVSNDGVVTPVGEGTATITVTAPATANYKEGTATATVKVSALPGQEVSFVKEGDQTATYGDAFENAATNATQNGGAITYASSNPDVATVDSATGAVTIVGAGETTISATAAGVEGQYAPTTASYKLTVAPKEITATASVADKTFDGTNEATVTNVAFEGVVGDDEVEYDATAAFADPNVGTGKTVTVTITIDDPNYTLSNGTITLNNGVITQAEAPTIPDRTFSVHFSDTAEKTFDLSDLMPANAGTTTFTRGEVADNNGNVLSVYEVQEDTFVYQLSEGLTEENAGTTVTVPVTITSQNYKEATAKLMISITDKWTPEVSAEDITVTYTGNPVPDSAIKGTATVNGILVEGAWSFAEGQTPVNVKDSGNKTVVFTPTDLNVYTTAQDTVLVTISKADPDGEPSYTAITGSGHTLADAALNKGTIAIPGAIVWDDGDDTVVEANTAYGWTFTPEDADNYKILTGTITPYVRSSGGGSGSGSSSTTRYSVTVKNSDNGDVEANVSRAAKGDTVTLTVTPDEGYVLDTLTVTAANGDKINLNRGSNGRYTFEMPASRVTVKATFVEEGGEEAAEPFVDVSAGDWFYDAVVYVYDNGLMSGTAATTFGPNVGTTRGMIATILWRLAGSPNGGANPFTDVSSSDYYAEAVAWAAGEGIVGGYGNGVFGANDPITREQMALMMYRYAQYAGYETSQRSAQLSSYADYASISDWAVEAVSWANAVGLMNGRTASTIVPTGTITRAEAATILMQFGENVQK